MVHVLISNKYVHIYWNNFSHNHHHTGIKFWYGVMGRPFNFAIFYYYGELAFSIGKPQ